MKRAFQNGDLNKEVFVEQIEGFVEEERKALRLSKHRKPGTARWLEFFFLSSVQQRRKRANIVHQVSR